MKVPGVNCCALVAAATLILHASPLDAQDRAPAPAKLTGVAVDSIRGGYLTGAVVFVRGTTLSAMTGPSGRFRIDSVPAGAHAIELQHPLLDTLAISLVTQPRAFAPGDSIFVLLSTPSAETVVARTCSDADRRLGPAALAGIVHDALTDEPATGATVTVEWEEYVIGNKTILNTPLRRSVPVSADGTFRICGLPDDLAAGVRASRGNDTTAVVNVDLRAMVGTASFRLPPIRTVSPGAAATPASPDVASATLTGRVVDAAGKPLSNARVAIESDTAVAITTSDGTFRLSGLRPGTRPLSVRRLGHRPVEISVELQAGVTSEKTVALTKEVTVLNTVQVIALRELGLDRVGFTARKGKRGGTFIDVREIQARNSPRLGELLRTVPVVRRPGCARYFVDGVLWSPMPGSEPDEYLSGNEIGAVEVYSQLSAPPEFLAYSAQGQPCKVIVVWTRWKLGPR